MTRLARGAKCGRPASPPWAVASWARLSSARSEARAAAPRLTPVARRKWRRVRCAPSRVLARITLSSFFGQQQIQSCRQLLRQVLEHLPVDQLDTDHIAQVHAVLIAVRFEFHGHERRERNHLPLRLQRDALIYARRGQCIRGSNFFPCPNKMHAIARIRVVAL